MSEKDYAKRTMKAIEHVTQIMIDLYKLIGMGLIGADSDDVANIAADRFTDFRIYINMLEEYRDIELFGESSASGIVKNAEYVVDHE